MICTVDDLFLQIEVKYLGETDASPASIACIPGKIVAFDDPPDLGDLEAALSFLTYSQLRQQACETVHTAIALMLVKILIANRTAPVLLRQYNAPSNVGSKPEAGSFKR